MTQKQAKPGVVVPLLIVALVLTHAGINWWVIKKDSIPFTHDMGTEYRTSVRLFYGLVSRDYSEGLPPLDFFYVHNTAIPPLYFFMSLPFYALFGPSQDIAMLSNLLSLALLIFGTFKLGELLHSSRAGLLSSALLSFFPFMFALSRTYNPKYLMVALLPLTFYFLVKSESFTRLGGSVLFGLMAGLSVLAYPNALFFLFAPACWVLGTAVVRALKPHSKKNCLLLLRNLSLSALPALLLVFPWVVLNYRNYFETRLISVQITLSGYQLSWVERLVHYNPLSILSIQISLPGLLFFLLAMAAFARKGKQERFCVLAWFLFPMAFFWLFVRNDAYTQLRYTIGYFPAIALITVIGILELNELVPTLLKGSRRHLPYALLGILLVLSSVQFIGLTFLGKYCRPYACPTEDNLNSPNYFGRFYPLSKPFDLGDIVDQLEGRSPAGTQQVLFLSPSMDLSNAMITEMEVRNLNPSSRVRFTISRWNDPFYNRHGPESTGPLEEPTPERLFPLIESSDILVYEDHGRMFSGSPLGDTLQPQLLSDTYIQWKAENTGFVPLFTTQVDGNREFAVFTRNSSI